MICFIQVAQIKVSVQYWKVGLLLFVKTEKKEEKIFREVQSEQKWEMLLKKIRRWNILCLLLFSSVIATALKSSGFALRVSLLREVTGAQGRRKNEFQCWACGLDSHPFQRMSWNQWILRFGTSL